MSLIKPTILLTITAIIIIALFAIYYTFGIIQNIYGNDANSIVQVINSIEGYELESVEILEIRDFGDERIVSFLSNNNPAFIHFIRNTNDNYEWRFITRGNPSFASFLRNIQNHDKPIFWIVTNEQNIIAKLHLYINDQIIEQDFDVNQKSVTWIDLPEAGSGDYRFDYKYFDKDGNLINQ